MKPDDDQFYAIMTSKRDECLAHLEGVVERSGVDEICSFIILSIKPLLDHEDEIQELIGHMAMIGAIDALISHRDRQAD